VARYFEALDHRLRLGSLLPISRFTVRVSYGEDQNFLPELLNDLEGKLVENESAAITAVSGPAFWSVLNFLLLRERTRPRTDELP